MEMSSIISNELRELAEGDVSAFNATYNRYFKAVYANVFKIVKSPEYAEEIVQDVFISLWQNRSKLKLDRSVDGWLFKVSYNKSISFLKQQVADSIDYVETYDFYESGIFDEDLDQSVLESKLEAVEEAIQLLSPRQKEILRLCKIKGKTKEEVALQLGITPETVKEHLKQSYRTIRSRIGKSYSNGFIDMVVVFIMLSLMAS